MRVEAVHAVSWLWRSDAPSAARAAEGVQQALYQHDVGAAGEDVSAVETKGQEAWCVVGGAVPGGW